MEKNISYFGNDPGAVIYGNFINYYSFHPPELRVSSVLDDIWKSNDVLILDVGCNSGDLTQKLYEYLISGKEKSVITEETSSTFTEPLEINNCFIVGLDLDSTLICRAKEGNKYPNNIFYECLDIMAVECDTKISEILHKFNKPCFDSIFCFSVSMWIHLNHGDEGLSYFISKMCKWSDCIVIEPQSWKSYTSAIRRLKRAGAEFCFPSFSDVTRTRSMETNIDNLFKSNDFVKVNETIPSEWSRKTFLYRRITK